MERNIKNKEKIRETDNNNDKFFNNRDRKKNILETREN